VEHCRPRRGGRVFSAASTSFKAVTAWRRLTPAVRGRVSRCGFPLPSAAPRGDLAICGVRFSALMRVYQGGGRPAPRFRAREGSPCAMLRLIPWHSWPGYRRVIVEGRHRPVLLQKHFSHRCWLWFSKLHPHYSLAFRWAGDSLGAWGCRQANRFWWASCAGLSL